MNRSTLGAMTLGLGISLLFACRPRESGISPADQKLFATAPPEIKQKWDQALQADQTNDYVKVQVILVQLAVQPGVSAPQKQAIASARQASANRMLQAFNRGDPVAIRAMEEIRTNAILRAR